MRSHSLLVSLLGAGFALLLSLPSSADEAFSKESIDKLIEQMGSGSFAEREKATKALSAIGIPALEALHKAAQSEDAEIRRRTEIIIPKIERQAESRRILAPKRVHLEYKDTPLAEALADLQKKSGYALHLHDPEGKLKDRTVTLDTGETTFWHAFGLLCDKAELTEGTLADLIQAPAAPPVQPAQAAPPAVAPRPAILRRGAPRMPGMGFTPKQLILKDGKAKKLPTDDASAVRVRALGKTEAFGNPGEGEVILALEATPEPKVLWEEFQSLRIDKALDDQNQKLMQVIPQVRGEVRGFGGGIGGAVAIQPIGVAAPAFAMPGMMPNGLSLAQQMPMQLKKGDKKATAIKELRGVITAQFLTEVQPMIVADKLKAGETFKGKEGGFIKIVEAKEEEEKTTIQVEFEQPPSDKIVPAMLNNAMPGVGGPIPLPIRRLPRQGVKIQPAPAPAPAVPPPGLAVQPPPVPPPPPPPVQVQIAVQGGGAVMIGGFAGFGGGNGLSLQDDKGNNLPIQIVQTQLLRQQQAGGGFRQTLRYTLVCQHEKDKAKPAKIVFLGRKRATVDIPFALKDVPLP